MNDFLDRRTALEMVKLVIIGMLIQLGVMMFVWYSDYHQRSELVTAQRAACERSKLDREANAEGWRIAQVARKDTGDFIVSARYAHIAFGLESRSRIVCADKFPKAGLLP